ncbi:cytochrome b5 [Backusella circina FSU 941]|nr:cytochrome b5 [Backusella circina FSU 941]
MATQPPKTDPITVSELKKYDGTDPSLPIYVGIKGDVFDVSAKREVYGAGNGYNVFTGKDSSKALGKSSLKIEDCVADYSDLTEKELQTLDEWHAFFSKRYNIVGKVVPDN